MSDYKERLEKFLSIIGHFDRPLAHVYGGQHHSYFKAIAEFKIDIQAALDRIKELEAQ